LWGEARDFALDGGDGFGERLGGWLGEQEVNVLGHDDVAGDLEVVFLSS
jgi:hypothetical protein